LFAWFDHASTIASHSPQPRRKAEKRLVVGRGARESGLHKSPAKQP
jgi:hypothetical protein